LLILTGWLFFVIPNNFLVHPIVNKGLTEFGNAV